MHFCMIYSLFADSVKYSLTKLNFRFFVVAESWLPILVDSRDCRNGASTRVRLMLLESFADVSMVQYGKTTVLKAQFVRREKYVEWEIMDVLGTFKFDLQGLFGLWTSPVQFYTPIQMDQTGSLEKMGRTPVHFSHCFSDCRPALLLKIRYRIPLFTSGCVAAPV